MSKDDRPRVYWRVGVCIVEDGDISTVYYDVLVLAPDLTVAVDGAVFSASMCS